MWILKLHYRYNDAMATIRRVPSIEHNFQLVVTRVYEDGDQELLEDEAESMCHTRNPGRLLNILQLMRNEFFSFPRNLNFVAGKQMENLTLSGAISKEMLMSSMSSYRLMTRTNLRKPPSRHGCIVPCSSGNSGQGRNTLGTVI
jgi:VID27 N-terminal region